MDRGNIEPSEAERETLKDKAALFGELQDRVHSVIQEDAARDDKLETVCRLLKDRVPYYDWVGFYLADQAGGHLDLGPFAGKPTDHVKIPFGRGVCGRAAAQRKSLIVQDVSRENNYLSCGVDVRSEIVVPMLKDGDLIGEIDIDSRSLSPFSREDRVFLEAVCERVSGLF